MTKVLAQNCALIEKTNTHIKLSIDTKHASLMNDRQKKQLHSALEDYLSGKINFSIDGIRYNVVYHLDNLLNFQKKVVFSRM